MPGFAEFKLLAQTAPYQLFRYAMDWDRQEKSTLDAVREWETTELGSLKGVLDAYSYLISQIVLEPDKHLSVDDLINIHAIATKGVDNMMPKQSPGRLRNAYSLSLGITPETVSYSGLRRLSQDMTKYLWLMPHFISIDASEVEIFEQLKACLEGPHRGFHLYTFDGNLTPSESGEFLHLSQTQLNSPRYQELSEKFIKNLKNEITVTLNTLYKELEEAQEENAMLLAMVKAIRKLEHIHPFYDGNCRTFCMILLNVLLMQNGFLPTLLDNPNKLDGYSEEELVILIREGMRRTRALCSYVTQEDRSITLFSTVSKDYKTWMEVEPSVRDELCDYASELTSNLLSAPIVDNTSRRISLILQKYKLTSDQSQSTIDMCLRRASAKGNIDDVISLLDSARADILSSSSNGKTALDWAKESNHEAVIEILETRLEEMKVAFKS